MKTRRQAIILELIDREGLHSQELLRRRLRQRGFEATQATISRDIKALGLVKRAGDGLPVRAPTRQPETVPPRSNADRVPRHVDRVQHLVVRTGPPAQPLRWRRPRLAARGGRDDRRGRHDPRGGQERRASAFEAARRSKTLGGMRVCWPTRVCHHRRDSVARGATAEVSATTSDRAGPRGGRDRALARGPSALFSTPRPVRAITPSRPQPQIVRQAVLSVPLSRLAMAERARRGARRGGRRSPAPPDVDPIARSGAVRDLAPDPPTTTVDCAIRAERGRTCGAVRCAGPTTARSTKATSPRCQPRRNVPILRRGDRLRSRHSEGVNGAFWRPRTDYRLAPSPGARRRPRRLDGPAGRRRPAPRRARRCRRGEAGDLQAFCPSGQLKYVEWCATGVVHVIARRPCRQGSGAGSRRRAAEAVPRRIARFPMTTLVRTVRRGAGRATFEWGSSFSSIDGS